MMGDETNRVQRGQVSNDEVDVLELLRVLWRHKGLLLAACVLGLAVAGGYLAATPKIYTATRTLILDLPSEEDMYLGGARYFIRKLGDRLTIHASSGLDQGYFLTQLASYFPQHSGVDGIDGEFSGANVNVMIVRIQGRDINVIGEVFVGIADFLAKDERIASKVGRYRAGMQRKLEADAGLLREYENLLERARTADNMVTIGFDVFRAIRDVQQDMAERRERLDALDASNLIEYVDDDFVITDVRPRAGLILVLSLVGGLLIAVLGILVWEAYARKTDT